MTAPCVRARCLACRDANAMIIGAACERHAGSWQLGLTRREIANLIRVERPGPIGPVPAIAFAYVTGIVPTFSDDGKRVE